MMRRILLTAATGIGLTTLALAGGASATPYSPGTTLMTVGTTNGIEQAAVRKRVYKKTVVRRSTKGHTSRTVTRRTTTRWVYDRHRHGSRFSRRDNVHRYYYGGYYYARPWWTVGSGVTIQLGVGHLSNRSAHVRWCFNHRRAYNPATNLYIGRDGRRHVCYGP